MPSLRDGFGQDEDASQPQAAGWLEAPLFSFRRAPSAGDLAIAVVACTAIASTGFDALGLRDPLAPFVAQEPGQTRLLLARAVVLFIAVARVRASDRAAMLVLGTAGALFVLCLVFRGLACVDLVVTPSIVVWVTRRTRRDEVPARAPRWVAPLLVAVACTAGLIPVRATTQTGPPVAPRDAVAYWHRRGNLYRAHAAALAWAREEAVPAEGYLALASVDWELGRVEKARRVVSKVLAQSTSDDVRGRAEELARRWTP